jgi:hypothetical protein
VRASRSRLVRTTSLVINLLAGAMLDPLVDIDVYVMAYNVDYDPMRLRLRTLVKGHEDEQVARWLPAELGVPRRRAIRAWLLAAAAGAACGAVFAEFHQGDRAIWHGILHGVGFLALLSGTIVAGWLTGAGLRRVPSTWSFGRWTHVSASVTSVLLVVDLVVPELVPGIGGVLQRVLLLAAFSWHITAGAYMLRTTQHRTKPTTDAASYTPPLPGVDGTPAAAGLPFADGSRRAPRPPAVRRRP